MRPYVIMAPKRAEMSALSGVVGFLLKKKGENRLPVFAEKVEKLATYTDGEDALQLLVCDVTANGVIPVLERLRKHNAQMKLVLLADGTVSPVTYIRPTILPTALLWRPLQAEDTSKVLWEVIATMPIGQADTQEQDLFPVEVRGVVKRYSYKDILFFEARDKKLFLHVQRQEIPFYGTLEKLHQELPEGFIRVHKSYVVNRSRVTEIQYGQNLLLMDGGMMVPISRSYKAEVKAVFA
ncbi:MAG: LytTR family transcriptional regulator DNA-binding domain-containing protein [Oscillospiraceae bacterium]|nr:LytTR family transcriptional regulator DNA-binding domain-containing protein [Oscillospiraceae bacterium]